MTIYPPLAPMMKYSFKLFWTLFVVIFIIFGASDYFNGRPVLANLVGEPLVPLFIFVGLPVALGLFLYTTLRIWSRNVGTAGVTGRSYWGRRSTIRWDDVGTVGFLSIEGIPALLISSGSSKREVLGYTLGVDIVEVHRALRKFAGPDHQLTRCFQTAT